jgi:hypothetical protein
MATSWRRPTTGRGKAPPACGKPDWVRGPAYVGVDQVRITCLSESVTHQHARPGGKKLRYCCHLTKLTSSRRRARWHRSLVAELGEPWGTVWQLAPWFTPAATAGAEGRLPWAGLQRTTLQPAEIVIHREYRPNE